MDMISNMLRAYALSTTIPDSAEEGTNIDIVGHIVCRKWALRHELRNLSAILALSYEGGQSLDATDINAMVDDIPSAVEIEFDEVNPMTLHVIPADVHEICASMNISRDQSGFSIKYTVDGSETSVDRWYYL